MSQSLSHSASHAVVLYALPVVLLVVLSLKDRLCYITTQLPSFVCFTIKFIMSDD